MRTFEARVNLTSPISVKKKNVVYLTECSRFCTVLDIAAWSVVCMTLTLRVQEFREAQVLLSDVKGLLQVVGCIGSCQLVELY